MESARSTRAIAVRLEAARLALRARFSGQPAAVADEAFRMARALEQAALHEAARQTGYPEDADREPWDPRRDHPAFTDADHRRSLGEALFSLR